MEITIVAGLLAERNVEIDTGHEVKVLLSFQL